MDVLPGTAIQMVQHEGWQLCKPFGCKAALDQQLLQQLCAVMLLWIVLLILLIVKATAKLFLRLFSSSSFIFFLKRKQTVQCSAGTVEISECPWPQNKISCVFFFRSHFLQHLPGSALSLCCTLGTGRNLSWLTLLDWLSKAGAGNHHVIRVSAHRDAINPSEWGPLWSGYFQAYCYQSIQRELVSGHH